MDADQSTPRREAHRLRRVTRPGRQTIVGDAENAGLENVGPNRRGGKDGTGKHGTKAHGWNSRDRKTQDQIFSLENARPPSIEREMDKYKVERNII